MATEASQSPARAISCSGKKRGEQEEECVPCRKGEESAPALSLSLSPSTSEQSSLRFWKAKRRAKRKAAAEPSGDDDLS